MPFLWPLVSRWAYDDPFITFRYAENLRAGIGFVYNPGEHVLSTTTPLYTVVLAVLGSVWHDLPTLSNALGVAALVAGAGMLTQLLPADTPLPLRIGGGIFASLAWLPLTTLGSEIPLYTLSILVTLYLQQRGHPGGAGLVAGLASVTRGDGLLLFAVVLVQATARRQWGDTKRVLAGFALGATPWYLFASIYFGSLVPATLAAKQAQHRRMGMPGFFPGFIDQLRALWADPVWLMVAGLAVLGVLGIVRRRSCPALLQWAFLYLAAYTGLGVGGYHWYYAPLVPAGIWLAVAGLTELYVFGVHVTRRFGTVPFGDHALAGLCAGLLAVAVWSEVRTVRQFVQGLPEGRTVVYEEVGTWVRKMTPPGSRVGALEVGIIGYHSGRPMVDFAGLIQPEVARAPGTSYVDWTAFAIQRYEPDYLALLPFLRRSLERAPWFDATYRRVHAIGGGGFGPVTIYEREGRR